MSNDLKKLVAVLEKVLHERGSLMDAPAREAFEVEVANLKKSVNETEILEVKRLRMESLKTVALLLSAITNVMDLFKP